VSDLYVNKIAPQAKAMQAAAEKARVQLQTSFGEARTATESSIARTVTIQEIIAALTLLIGGLIAFFLARGLQPDHGADPKHARDGGRQLRRRASRPRPQGRSRQHRPSRRRVQSASGPALSSR